jgi:hypothetical protein
MKISASFILLIFPLISYSQDHIITKESETLTVRIVREEKKSVIFFLTGEQDQSIQKLDKKQIKRIKYEDPPNSTNTIVIVDDSLKGKDLFSNITSYLIESGYELGTFDIEHLTVSAFTSSGTRISAEVEDKEVRFSLFEPELDENNPPSQSERNVIRLAPPDQKEEVVEKYPGEERLKAGSGSFRELDRVCRNYLLTNKGKLKYMTE